MPTSEELLKQANIALQKAVDEKNSRKLETDRKFILAGIGKDLNDAIKPTLTQIARDNASVARETIAEMKKAKMPDVVIPKIDIPKPQVDVNVDLSSLKVPQPKINVSPILRPDITFPKEMDIKGWVQLQGVDLGHPLPVQLRDADGKPVNLFENLTTLVGGGGGGIAKIVKISDILKTIDVNVTGATGSMAASLIDSSGVGYSGSNPLPVVFGAGATTGSNVVDSSGVAYSGSNPFPITGDVAVSGITGTVGANIVDSGGEAYTTTNPLPVDGDFYPATQPISAAALPLPAGAATAALQLPDGHNVTVDNAGAGSAVNIQDGGNTITVDGTVVVSGITATVGTNIVDSDGEAYTSTNPVPVSLETRLDSVNDSIGTLQVSGSIDSVYVTGFGATVAANIVDSDGEAYTTTNPVPVTILSGAGSTTAGTILDGEGNYRDTFPVEGTVAVSGLSGTVNAVLVDSAGAYRGTVPIEGTVAVSGITNSVQATIIDSAGEGYSNTNPMTTKIGDGVDTLDLTQTLADNVNATVTLPVAGYNYGYESGTWDRLMSTDGRLQIADGGASISVDDGAGTLSVDGTVAVSGVTASVQATIIDSTGVGYSGSNPVPITGLIRPVQVRGSLKTAYVTENEIQEVVLLAGVASEFHDLIFAMCANESTGAINLDFRQTTGGTVQMSVEVPANGTAGVSVPIPIPQDHADATWTVQNSATDNSNTVYSVTALFSKET